MRIVALGELLIDFANIGKNAAGFPIMEANPGGAPANFLAAALKAGCEASFIGKVGDDTFGHLLIKTLDEIGIDTEGILVDPNTFTTLAFVTHDDSGDRSFSFARKPGADTQLMDKEINFELLQEADLFHYGTLSLTDEPSKSATKYAVKEAHKLGKWISFDPNLREPLWDDLEDAKEAIFWGLRHTDIVKISDNEVEFLFPGDTIEEAAEKIHAMGVQILFITLGANGAFLSNGKQSGYVPAYEKINVKDTTGAGDIFGGTAIGNLVQLQKPLENISLDDLKEITKKAVLTASLSTEKMGGLMSVPTREEIDAYSLR